MNTYTHTLTDIEVACGVTLEDVARELARGVFRRADAYANTDVFIVDAALSPALALSVARCAFSGEPVEYVGTSALGRAYRVAVAS